MVIKVDDIVMAYHGVMIYDAKVLKIDHGSGVQDESSKGTKGTTMTQYYVHYQGWHKKWDEWVAHDRVLEDTPANRALQKQAKEDAKKNPKSAVTKKKKISTSGIDPSAAKKSPFKKLKRNAENDTEEMPSPDDESVSGGGGGNAKQISIQMPFSLKKQLVEDWRHITQEPYRLVSLPRKPTVSQIIKNYLEFKKSKLKAGDEADEKEYKNLEGIMEGIQSYFDRALGSILLYRMERKQYHEIKQKNEDVPVSEIYGAEHLIRLFVRLPILLGGANLPPRELASIQSRLNDFLKYIQKNAAAWFSPEYELATEKYVDQALNQKAASAASS
ncbi:Chromatin modification-related protein eaf3, partial [Globisporangium splendens]